MARLHRGRSGEQTQTRTCCSIMRVKLNWIEVLVIPSVVGVIVALLMPAGDRDLKHRYPPPASRSIPGPAGFAGNYQQGDGRGTNLRLSILPDGRYSFVSSGCTGVGHRESGFVRAVNGQYALSPSEPSKPPIKRTFVLVGWGQRHYLIPPVELQELCDAIIEGKEPRDDEHGRFYIRLPIAPAEGLPDSPHEWANALREELVLGRVKVVSAVGRARIGRANFDPGAKDGAPRGRHTDSAEAR